MKKVSRIALISTFVAVGSMSVSIMAATTIGAQKAKKVALDHAKLNEKNVTFTKAHMDNDDGVAVYEVEFYHNGTEYDYEIGATSGKIRTFSKEKESTPVAISSKPTTSKNTAVLKETIGAQKAKEVALTHAKLNGKTVTFTKASMDTDDGVTVYEVEFYHNGIEYNYEINAVTGKVVAFETDND